jgi:hypothetical protein
MIAGLYADSSASPEKAYPDYCMRFDHPAAAVLAGISLISKSKKYMEKSAYFVVNFKPDFVSVNHY